MKKVELIKGVSSSILGFGCAPIMGSVGAKQALRAIDCALDYGITHFDLARSYGYGDAEGFVGRALQNKRDQVVLATKVGIVANWKASLLKPAKPIFRFLADNLKQNQEKSNDSKNAVASSLHNRINIDGATMRASLEKSLKALQTDYIDYFFLHEPLERIDNIDELHEVAEKLKTEGKIRGHGLAFMRSQEHFHFSYINKFNVLQFNNSPGAEGYDLTKIKYGQKPNVIFSPIKGGDMALNPSKKLNILFNDFPNSVVLCSMFNEKHIKENSTIANELLQDNV